MGGVEELMSDIDKRVVQMDFDNKKFERNVKESTESIGKLKKSLNFDGVSNSIDQVSVKIKALEVMTTTALVNITNRITNLGIQMIKSLSVDNISAGWAKYGQKTTSVATMMAQNFKIAGKEITDASEKMSVVATQLERLSWFSDETSYTFTDMIDNVGKFIAAGQDLDVSVQAMEGIATWAALSGQNASTASRAMYQLSQAIGKGKIQLIDYKSIQNANMDTVEFRQTILDTAVALGQLTKEGDKFVTKTGKKFSQSQFAEELSEGWFTSEVLVKGLSKYSAAVDQIYELANKEGLTASEVIEKYGDELDDFGLKAFKAAQEARTFADVLSSVKDAVSSKWMTTSELIFGDKNESVSLWTDLSNALYEVFAESGNFRNEILKVWKALGGREDLFKRGGDDQGAFWNIYDAIVNLKNLIKSAWNTIFPLSEMEDESAQANDIGNKIKTLTGNLKAFTKRLQMSEATSLRIRKILEGLFSVLKGFLVILKAILYILDPVIELGKQLITTIIDKLISLFGKVNINGNKLIKLSNKLHDALENLFDSTIDFSGIFKTIIKTLKAIVSALANVFKKISEFIASTGIIGTLNNFWEAFINAAKTFGNIFKNTISKVFASMKSLFDKTVKKMQKLSPAFDKLKRSFQGFIDTIKKAPSSISNFVKSLFGSKIASNLESKILRPTTKSLKKFSKAIESINEVSSANIESKKKELSPIAELFSGIGKLLNGIGLIAQALVVTIGKMLGLIGDVLSGIGTAVLRAYNGTLKLEEWQKNLLITSVILGGILALVALIGTRVYNIFYSVIAIVKPLGVLVDSISGLIDKAALTMMGSFIKSISNAVLQFSISLMIIAGIDAKRLESAVWTMLAISTIIAGIVAAVLVIQKKSEQLNTAIRAVTTVTKSTGKGITGWISNFSSSLSEAKKMDKIRSLAIVIQNFGTAMVKIALALYVIGQLEWSDMLKGLVVMVAVLAEMFALSKLTTSNEVDVKKAIPGMIQMIALSIMIQSFGVTARMLTSIEWGTLINIAKAIGLVMLAFGSMIAIMNRTNGNTDAKSSIAAIMSMSIALIIVGKVIQGLAKFAWNQLITPILGITVILAALLGFEVGLSKIKYVKVKSSLKLLVGMSAMLISFGASMLMVAKVPWENILASVRAISLVLAAVLGFGVILKLFKVTSGDLLTSLLGIATSLIALSASLLIMVNVFKQFESISWESLGKGAAVLAGSLVLLGVSAAILSPVISVILLLSSALVLLGVGMSLSAMSILLVIQALQELSTMSATSIQSTTDSLNALAELIASALLSGLQSLFDGMTELLPSVFDTISIFLDKIISLLGDKIPTISSLALNLIEDTLATIKDKSASILDSIFGIIDNFFSELTKDSKIASIIEKAVDAIVQVLNAIAKKTDELIESILNVLLSLVTSLFNNRQLLYDITGRVLNLIMDLLIKIVKDVVKLAGAIAKVMLILIAAAIKVVIASLGGLASLFIEFISAVLLILVHTVIGMTDVIYQVFKTIIYNLIYILNQVLMDIGPMLAVMLKTGFQSFLAGILEAIAILIKDIPVVNALYDPIHNAAEDMKKSVKNTMDEYSDILSGDNVLKAAKKATTNIKHVVKESTKQINDTLTDSISDINEAVADSSKQLSEAMDDFANGFQIDTNEGQRQSEKAGKDITDGLTKGIEENTKEVKKAGAAAGQAAVDGAREETDTHSPSRVMFKLGQYLVDGLSLGIADKKNEAVDSMTKMVSQAINATQDTIENQNGDDLTLKVGLDISGVEAKSRKITDIMSGLNNVEATTYGKNALYTAKRLKKSSSEEKIVTQDDHSSTVTYNNVFNVSSTDPERSAEEIDKALSRQAAKARLAHGAV